MVMSLVFLVCSVAEPENVLINPGFEMSDTGYLVGWTSQTVGGRSWTPFLEESHEGKACMQLKASTSVEPGRVELYSDPFPVFAGECIDYELWARNKGMPLHGLSIAAECRIEGRWKSIHTTRLKARTSIPDWRSLRGFTAIVPNGANEARLVVSASNNTGNSSFENIQEGSPMGWEAKLAGKSRWRPTTDQFHSGKRSMVLQGEGAGMNEWVLLASDSFPVEAGEELDYGLWVRCEGKPTYQLRLTLRCNFDGVWKPVHSVGIDGTEATESWQPLGETKAVIPDGASEARLSVVASRSEPDTVTWYVDDVRCPKTDDVVYYVDDFACRVTSFAEYIKEKKGSKALENIALIGVDTLRRDELGCYGSDRTWTPNIDSLAAEGVLFEKTTTASPWTKPSFASIFTSLYPSQHTTEHIETPLPEDLQTLAESLKEAGYFTAGFVFSAVDGFLGASMGFGQGFDVYFQSSSEEQVYEACQKFLETNAQHLESMDGGGIFIFYHIFAPHRPHINRNAGVVQNEGLLGTVHIDTIPHMRNIAGGKYVLGEDYNEHDIAYIRKLYSWEVNYTDQIVGRFITMMKWTNLYDKLNVVFCADHGELFGERGEYGHGNCYDACAGTPLILRFPGTLAQGIRNDSELVSNLDIMPTLLELADVPIPDQCLGKSLIKSGESTGRHSYTSQFGVCEDVDHGWFSISDQDHKLVVRNTGKRTRNWDFLKDPSQVSYELFDLKTDPLEKQDIAKENPNALEKLRLAMNNHFKFVNADANQPLGARNTGDVTVSEETREQLRALGYVD